MSIPFRSGDKVKVHDGSFQNMEGEIKKIHVPNNPRTSGRIKIEIELAVYGRPVSVEVDYWQIDAV